MDFAGATVGGLQRCGRGKTQGLGIGLGLGGRLGLGDGKTVDSLARKKGDEKIIHKKI